MRTDPELYLTAVLNTRIPERLFTLQEFANSSSVHVL